jgi:ribonuclease P/MRP protein subunit POP1
MRAARRCPAQPLTRCHPRRQAGAAPALPRRLRRRAGSHKPYTQPRRPNAKRARLLAAAAATADAADADAPPQAPPPPPPAWLGVRCRRARRRPAALLRAVLAPSAASSSAAADDDASPPPPPRRLPTHAWHAKRFRMAPLPGGGGGGGSDEIHVAAGLFGAGRGSRAFLRFARRRCVAHDASYLRPLQLCGAEGALRRVLLQLTRAEGDAAAALGCAEVRGGCACASVTLHAPSAAGGARPLAPATLQWRPRAPLAPSCAQAPPRRGGGALWLWLHAAAVCDVLAAAAPLCAAAGVSLSLRADLCRFELVGATATSLAARVLVPSARGGGAGGPWPCGAPAAPPGAVAAARCRDPRAAAHAHAHAAHDDADADDADDESAAPPPPALWPADASHADDAVLWRDAAAFDASGADDVAKTAPPLPPWLSPAPEAALCARAAASRRFSLEHGAAAAAKRDAADDNADDDAASVMPALLLRRAPPARAPALGGWSIVVPSAWAQPLWRCLIGAGAAAAGRLEWGWLALDAGAARFPEHFPDTPAGRRAARKAEEDAAAAQQRKPKGKRAPEAPPPPWQRRSSADGGDNDDDDAGVYVARTAAAAAAAMARGGAAASPSSPSPSPPPPPLPFRGALLRVRVTLPGAGVARPGAALYALAEEEEAEAANEGANEGAEGAEGRETWVRACRGACLGRVLSAAPRGAHPLAGAVALCDAAALGAARARAHAGARKHGKGRPLRCLLAADASSSPSCGGAGGAVLRAALAWVCVEDAAHGRDACWDA